MRRMGRTDLSPPVSSASGEGTLIVALQDRHDEQRLFSLTRQSLQVRRESDATHVREAPDEKDIGADVLVVLVQTRLLLSVSLESRDDERPRLQLEQCLIVRSICRPTTVSTIVDDKGERETDQCRLGRSGGQYQLDPFLPTLRLRGLHHWSSAPSFPTYATPSSVAEGEKREEETNEKSCTAGRKIVSL